MPLPYPFCLFFLAVAVAACGDVIPAKKDGAAPCLSGCADAAPDGAGTPGVDAARDSAGDATLVVDRGDAADLGIPPDVLPAIIDAAVDAPADVAMVISRDLAPDLTTPDAAVDAAADAAADTSPPDVAVVVPPDAAPDVAPDLAPDLAPDVGPDLAPDLPPPPPPDVAPDVTPGNGCPTGGGPTMIKADLGSAPFCIDSSEVTNAQYAAFLAATGDGSQTGGQPTACGWNSSYRPGTDGTPWPYAAGKENRPVVNVDWCDARAFCLWAGKRLCGKIGGGSLTGSAAAADPPTSQWASACTRAWDRDYPYGDTFQSSYCNIDAPSENAQYIDDVKSNAMCVGGYTGLHDMSGNVEEWVDACDGNTGATNECASAGTSTFLDGLTPAEITCADSVYGTTRDTQWVMLGFRCCADL